MDFPFSAIFRVENGKIASIRLYYDQVEVLTQLGLMPPPASADQLASSADASEAQGAHLRQ